MYTRRRNQSLRTRIPCHYGLLSAIAVLLFLSTDVSLWTVTFSGVTRKSTQPAVLKSSFSKASTATNEETSNTFPDQSATSVIDIVSIGSRTRPSYQETQKAIFGTHSSVRNFINATEEIDSDRNCSETLDRNQLARIVLYCRYHSSLGFKNNDPSSLSSLAKEQPKTNTAFYTKKHGKKFVPLLKLLQKSYPMGWLCAQKRPLEAFYAYMQGFVLQHHRKNNSNDSNNSGNRTDIPDYLFVIDDDTYVNLNLVEPELRARFPAQRPHAIVGRLISSQSLYTFPLGGFGIIFTKPVLEKFIQPIHCESEGDHSSDDVGNDDYTSKVCAQIALNSIGERPLFHDGMSVLDLLNAVVTLYRYTDFQHWNSPGYCMHSDWVWGYFVKQYALTDPTGLLLQPYMSNASMYGERKKRTKLDNVLHDNLKEPCTVASPFCHYATPNDMLSLHNGM